MSGKADVGFLFFIFCVEVIYSLSTSALKGCGSDVMASLVWLGHWDNGLKNRIAF